MLKAGDSFSIVIVVRFIGILRQPWPCSS